MTQTCPSASMFTTNFIDWPGSNPGLCHSTALQSKPNLHYVITPHLKRNTMLSVERPIGGYCTGTQLLLVAGLARKVHTVRAAKKADVGASRGSIYINHYVLKG